MKAEAEAESSSTDTQGGAPARRSTTARYVMIGLLLAFAAWFGVRMRAAIVQRQAQASERAQAVQTARDSERGLHRELVAVSAAGTWRATVPLEGTLQPMREAELGFKAGGRLAAIRVRAGDSVRAGDTLGWLDDGEARAQVQACEAQVRAAEAQLALAGDAKQRVGALVGQGAATAQNDVQVTQQHQLAQAQLDAARAQLALAQANLRNHTLAAPFAGVITRVPSGTGAIVGPGVTLYHLQDTSTLKLVATVGEGDAALLKVGAEVELHGGRGDGKRGRIVAVMPSVDAATRRVPVEAEVKNEHSQLTAGVFVRAVVAGLDPVPVVKLPAAALRPGAQSEVVVAESGRLQRRAITYAVADDGALLVRAGLKPGERVVAQPTAEMQDGDLVQ